MKKPLSKRLNHRKGSKVTFKTHSKRSHHPIRDDRKVEGSGVSSVRPEEINFHQNYQ